MTKVAVYGSLREGMHNHSRLLGAEKVGTTVTVDKFAMYSLGGFPAVQLEGSKVSPIVVEVYDCNEDQMRSLDSLEGFRGKDHPHNFYNRSPVETELGEALIYHIEGERFDRLVEDGDWVNFTATRSNRY